MLGICTMNCLISPIEAEFMGRYNHNRERDTSPCIEAFPKENLSITEYMITAWRIKKLDVLGHYIIRPIEMEKLLIMKTNLTTLDYIYTALRIKKPPDILGILRRLTHPLDSIGRHRTPSHHMAFSGTRTQEYPITFDNSTRYTLWDLGCTCFFKP